MFESFIGHARTSHGLLADSVDTSLTGAVFSEVHDHWARRERRR